MKKYYFYAILSAILFGTAGLFIKFAYKTGLDSMELLTFQYILAVTIMFVVAIIKDKRSLKVSKKELFNLFILGIIGNTFMTVFYYIAFEYLPVAMVTMLLYTYPIMVFIYSIIFDKTKVTKRSIGILSIAFFGSVLVLNVFSSDFNYSIKGIFIGLLCAVFYSFMNIYSEKKLKDVPALTINTYSTFFSLLVLLIYVNPSTLVKVHLSLNSIFYIAVLAIVSEIIPLTLLYLSIKFIGSVKVSIIGNLEIPTAMFTAFLFLNEKISVIQLLGAGMVICAIILLERGK